MRRAATVGFFICLLATAVRWVSATPQGEAALQPRFFISQGERLTEVLGRYLPDSMNNADILDNITRLNTHIGGVATPANLLDPLPRNTIVVLPDRGEPETPFVWFTCNRVEQLLEEWGSISDERFIRNRVGDSIIGHKHDGIIHLYYLTSSLRDDNFVGVVRNVDADPDQPTIFFDSLTRKRLAHIVADRWWPLLAGNPIR